MFGEDENAANLNFDAEFKDAEHLSNDEVFIALSRRAEGGAAASGAFEQTLEYLKKVATSHIPEDLFGMVTEIETQLRLLELEVKGSRERKPLNPFEIKSLANLIKSEDTTPEEALCWIPSLCRYDDEEIVRALNIVIEAKARVTDSI